MTVYNLYRKDLQTVNRDDFKKILSNKKPFILDGSTGANLMKAGMPNNVCPELWITENSGVLLDLQKRYVESGSMALCTATLGANREALKRYGLDSKTDEINRKLTEITQKAVDGKAYVMGDICPSGLFMKPYGEASFEQMYDIFYEQAKILDDAGVDMFIVETQLNLSETRAAVLAIKDVCDKPILACMTVDEKGMTMSGNKISACLLILSSLGVDAVGCNCSLGPKIMLDILNGAKKYSSVPLIAKANAGKPHGTGKDMYFDVNAQEFYDACIEIANSGVQVIGGCCGTTPEYIGLLKDLEFKAEGNISDISMIAANEKEIFCIDNNIIDNLDNISCIECSPNLEDDIMDELDDDADIIRLRINSIEDADILLENSFLINVPLMIDSDNREALDIALKKYAGRAIIDPECKICDNELINKYNPVVIR